MKNALFNEFIINYKFVRRDICAIVLPGALFAVCALSATAAAPLLWATTLAPLFLCFWLMLTFFCISNQLTAVEEDKINKPDRPVACGMVSLRGAQLRVWASGAAALALAAYLAITLPVALFLIIAILHNYMGLGNHWLSKNLLVSLGIFATLAAGWQAVTEIDATALGWVAFISVFWFLLAHIQDLRDIEGDRKIGRRTLPLVIGENRCRIQLALSFILLPFLMIAALGATIWCSVFYILSFVIALRVIVYRNAAADDRTYSLFLGLYCVLIISFLTSNMV